MLTRKILSYFIVSIALAASLPNAHAQEVFAPLVDPDLDYFEPDFQFFAPAQLGEFGNGPKPKQGFFFSYERVNWAITPPQRSQIGDPTARTNTFIQGIAFSSDNSLDNGFLDAEFGWGNRYEMGYVVDNKGWLLGVMGRFEQPQQLEQTDVQIGFRDPAGILRSFVDLSGPLGLGGPDGVDDDLNGNSTYGRNGMDLGTPTTVTTITFVQNPPNPAIPVTTTTVVFLPPFDGTPDLAAPADLGDTIVTQPIFDQVIARNLVEMSSVELMYIARSHTHWHGVWEVYAGARYLEIDDTFSLFAMGSTFDETRINHKTDNHIIGPQIGLRWSKRGGRWTVGSQGRFMAGANFRSIHQEGVLGSIGVVPPRGAFANSFLDEHFSPVGELRFDLRFQATRDVALAVGYTGTVAGNIARASNTIDWVVPQMGVRDPGDGETLFANGVNFGVEINR